MIEVTQLTRIFRTYKKQPGFWGGVRGLFHREYEETAAAKDVSMAGVVGTAGMLGDLGESLLKRDRADLHVRFVDWAEAVNAARGRGQEFEEIHGYHLEQAYRYRVQLGVVDDSVRAIGGRASAKLASALK